MDFLKREQKNDFPPKKLKHMEDKRFKLNFYKFVRFREESRHMLKLLVDKCICFRAKENPEFPLTIQIVANPCI